jgi:hypothetical protein
MDKMECVATPGAWNGAPSPPTLTDDVEWEQQLHRYMDKIEHVATKATHEAWNCGKVCAAFGSGPPAFIMSILFDITLYLSLFLFE